MSIRSDLIEKIWRGRDPFDGFPSQNYYSDMQGWGSNHKYLTEAVVSSRPKIIVEVGVWKGGSTMTMARALKENNIPGVVISVDTWLGSWDHWHHDFLFKDLPMDHGQPMMIKGFMKNIVDNNLQDFVIPLPLDSLNAAELMKRKDISVDLFHLDGGHDYLAVKSDLNAWWPVINAGGTVIGDDYYTNGEWPGVRSAFDEFVGPFGLGPIEHIDGKCILRKT